MPPKRKKEAAASSPAKKKKDNSSLVAAKVTTTMSSSASAAPAPAQYPRISNKLSLVLLKEEAVARRLDPKNTPKRKADLLHYLVEGSIHVKETQTYKEYQALLRKVETEKADLHVESLKNHQETEARKEKLRLEKESKEEKKRLVAEKHQLVLRKEECERQKLLHVHSFPRVHHHPLAKTGSLLHHGIPRFGRCDKCGGSSQLYSCDDCDWDICQECFTFENKSDAEKKRIKVESQRKREAEEQEREEEHRREQEALRDRWDARKRFKANIIVPAAKHKKLSSKLKFTVWCSDGYGNDGWHSYEGAPDQEFDSMWSTKKEANERAEYLFFWKNPWGLCPNAVNDDTGDPEPGDEDGLQEWRVCPPDSTQWTVGAVPVAAYRHLGNATSRRHNYDDEREPKGYEESYGCFF